MAVAALFTMSATAQEKFEQGKPNNPDYDYLNEYAPLKEYIDREKYPNFKLGAGTTVNEYLNKGIVYKMTNKNFNETVAGNAMKMASCVDANGNMNFSNVTRYVNEATAAGLNVYGHTLAWHSQQPNGWLLKLLADKPAEEIKDGDVSTWAVMTSKDFRNQQNVGWTSDKNTYGFSLNFSKTDGLNIHCTKKCTNSWDVQFLAMTDIPTKTGKNYKMTMTVRGTSDGRLHTKLGDWNGGPYGDVSFTTEWKEVTYNYKATMSNSFYMLQCGDFVGDIYIKDIKFEEEIKGRTITEDRRCLKVHTNASSDPAATQLWIMTGTSFISGTPYVIKADILADKAAAAATLTHSKRGDSYWNNALGDINFSPTWNTITISGTFPSAGQEIILNLNKFAEENDYYLDNVSVKINDVETIINGDFEGDDLTSFKIKQNGGELTDAEITSQVKYVYVPTVTPLTAEEKHDTLVYAMDKWISGMMKACNGKVKAWDVVNEAISGGGNDGQGNYTLQHYEGYNPNGTWDVGGDAFYWQDFMGDLEYVRQAVRLARKYGPEDIKLFINDYNLESTWDGNKKLKSLINWIKKWESDGVTKIDGIGTQMHISYLLDEEEQKNQMRCITTMFELMAATGKLVRVSELDMGVCEKQFQPGLKTSDITSEMDKKMAEYYEWIIKEYLRIIPPAQQWGICQWCTTDAPSYSGWRGGEPVGIFDLNYYRKHVYAGFANGLGGSPTGIVNMLETTPAVTNGAIYDLRGIRQSASSLDELPRGIYVINGRKVAK